MFLYIVSLRIMTILDSPTTESQHKQILNPSKKHRCGKTKPYLWEAQLELAMPAPELGAGIGGVFRDATWNPAANNNRLTIAPENKRTPDLQY